MRVAEHRALGLSSRRAVVDWRNGGHRVSVPAVTRVEDGQSDGRTGFGRVTIFGASGLRGGIIGGVGTEPPILDYASPRRRRPIDPARVVGIIGFSLALLIAASYILVGVFALIGWLLSPE